MTASPRIRPSRSELIGLLVANAFSLSGTRLSQIAVPWFVITTTGSAAQTGLVAFAQLGPYVVAKALAGPLIDRIGPRRVVVTGEVTAAAVIGAVPVLHALGLLHVGVLVAMVTLLGTATGPSDGGKGALIPAVAEAAQVPLERVTGLYSSIERLATTVGAAAAGALVALLGPVPAMWVPGGPLMVSGLVIAGTGPVPQPAEGGGYMRDLTEGLRFITHDRLLRSVYSMVAATNLLDAAMVAVLLPVWAHETGAGPAAIGLLAAALGGAATVSSVLAAAIGHRMPRRLTYFVGFLIAGLPRFAVLAVDAPLWLAAAVHVVAGLGSGFLNPILGAVIFERIPSGLVGRVHSMGSSLAWAGMPFGGLLGGGLIAAAGLAPALLICGVAYLAVTLLPGLQREWKQMNQRVTSDGSRAPAPGGRGAAAAGRT